LIFAPRFFIFTPQKFLSTGVKITVAL